MSSPSQGRQPLYDEPLSEKLNLKLTPSQKGEIAERAKKAGYSSSEYLRRLGLGLLESDGLERHKQFAAQIAEQLRSEFGSSPNGQICISLDEEKRTLAEATAKRLQVESAEIMLRGLMNWAILNPEAAQAAFPVAEVEEIAKSRAARALAPKASKGVGKTKKAA